jgi:peptidyl-dipeptidase A
VRTTHLVATEASALLHGALAWRRDWLERVLGLSAATEAELEERLLSARACELLVFTRWVLVMNAFERALYADPDGDLDSLWWELVRALPGREPARRPPVTGLGREDPHRRRARLLPHLSVRSDRRAPAGPCARGGRSAESSTARRRGALLRERLFAAGEALRWDRLVEQASGSPLSVESLARAVARS